MKFLIFVFKKKRLLDKMKKMKMKKMMFRKMMLWKMKYHILNWFWFF